MTLTADRVQYRVGWPVGFAIDNASDSVIVFPRQPPWTITNALNDSVIAPQFFLIVLDPLAAGRSASFEWDQRDYLGNQVAAGEYAVRIRYWLAESLGIATDTFRIVTR